MRIRPPRLTVGAECGLEGGGCGRGIAGASRGIGAAVARLLASRGMRVVVNYRISRDEADDVARAVAFYAGDDSGFITGIAAPVNGGLAMD